MPLGCLLAARVDKKPLMCGLGVPVGCQSGHKKPLMCGLAGLERFKGLEGPRAGKRQTWTPIRSH